MNLFDHVFNFEYKNNIGLVNMTGEFFALYVKRIFDSQNRKQEGRSVLIVTPSLYEASSLYNAFGDDKDVLLFETDDVITSEAVASSPEFLVNRLSVLNDLLVCNKKIVITDLNGYLKLLPSLDDYKNSILTLNSGMQIEPNELLEKLYNIGYTRDTFVTKTGEVGVRGFILDIFPIGEENPIRIEFFGDTIEDIRYFDIDTQKSIKNINSITIKPFSDKVANNYSSLFDYLDNPIVFFKDYSQLQVTYDRMVSDVFEYFKTDKKCFFSFSDIPVTDKVYYFDLDNDVTGLNLDDIISFDVASIDKLNEDIDKINNYLNNLIKNGKTPILFLSNIDVTKFLSFLTVPYVLTDLNNIFDAKVNVVHDYMYRGFIYKNYAFITEYELFNRKNDVKRSRTNFKYATRIKDLAKLEVGDYVVHDAHGIGIYNGIKSLKKGDLIKDYIEVLYDKGDKLYIPVSKIDLLSKYSGKEGYTPHINSLNSTAWVKTKQKVREKIKYEAERLIKVQAMRELKQGFAFSKDTPMQELFESKFPYDMTVDQINVTNEIKNDMESIHPMDRILCGDVGYGKTEVAFRAMFKAVMDSKQVLYVCPTTLLSKQQYDAALSRFQDFPVNIRLLNRFTTPKETEQILNELKTGGVDIVFGTHRLLSNDILPKDLGLLVIDEEQRFGVAHKEKIKEFKSNVDVLTLTATPIPRTLQMAMLGIKNLSLIETPPKNRHPVQTYVTPFDRKVIKDIIYKEISRGGQVYVLYNYVSDIDRIKDDLQRLVPDASIIIAHGQMPKKELEDRITSFVEGKYNVLLCTTIIETGIDIPNANSLIILDADHFGLSQLYQIRGRVGRSDRIAYAYLMYNKGKVLTETAIKRLHVIKEFTELGSGFRIAARDLSIRGAGDILGSEQAGFIDTVGIDLYMKMLNDEILRLKGIEVEEKQETDNAPVDVETHIKDSYVSEEDIKIAIHKLINTIDSKEKYLEVEQEIKDRFGLIDDNMLIYMNEKLFESFMKKLGINQVVDNNKYIELEFSKEKSEDINYEDLFISSIDISNNFKFSYKNSRLFIKLDKTGLVNHPLFYLNSLLERM